MARASGHRDARQRKELRLSGLGPDHHSAARRCRRDGSWRRKPAARRAIASCGLAAAPKCVAGLIASHPLAPQSTPSPSSTHASEPGSRGEPLAAFRPSDGVGGAQKPEPRLFHHVPHSERPDIVDLTAFACTAAARGAASYTQP